MFFYFLNKLFRLIFIAFCLWAIVRLFLFQVYTVPTDSMNNTYFDGDKIVVNKISYGSRLPITPLSIHIGDTKKYLDWISIPYFRIFGYSKIHHNDVIAFNLPTEFQFPIDERKESVKRCIALPGDIITIKKGDVYINNNIQNELTALKWFSVKYNQLIIDTLTIKQYIPLFTNSSITSGETDVFISQSSANSILKCKGIISIQKKYESTEKYSPTFFPNASIIKWNPDNFGPYYIPKKGQLISLTKNAILLYSYLIEKHENNTLGTRNDSVFINGSYAKYYAFKMDYYFCIGDNRYNSIDSRYWGLIPENHIIGIAQ